MAHKTFSLCLFTLCAFLGSICDRQFYIQFTVPCYMNISSLYMGLFTLVSQWAMHHLQTQESFYMGAKAPARASGAGVQKTHLLVPMICWISHTCASSPGPHSPAPPIALQVLLWKCALPLLFTSNVASFEWAEDLMFCLILPSLFKPDAFVSAVTLWVPFNVTTFVTICTKLWLIDSFLRWFNI